jgi:hypothetical protein
MLQSGIVEDEKTSIRKSIQPEGFPLQCIGVEENCTGAGNLGIHPVHDKRELRQISNITPAALRWRGDGKEIYYIASSGV